MGAGEWIGVEDEAAAAAAVEAATGVGAQTDPSEGDADPTPTEALDEGVAADMRVEKDTIGSVRLKVGAKLQCNSIRRVGCADEESGSQSDNRPTTENRNNSKGKNRSSENKQQRPICVQQCEGNCNAERTTARREISNPCAVLVACSVEVPLAAVAQNCDSALQELNR